MILILMILPVMMIQLQQSVFPKNTTKASVYTARNFAVRHYIILGLPFMYLPFGARSIVASDWDLFFCIRSNTYDLYHRYRLCCTSNNLPGNSEPCLLGIAYNRETTNNIQVIERFRYHVYGKRAFQVENFKFFSFFN